MVEDYEMNEPQQHETPPEDGPQGLASRAILDEAMEVVVRWRRQWPGGPVDGAGAPAVDSQTLRDLLDFFRDSKNGLLTPEEIVREAGMWQEVLALEWPADDPDLVPVGQAVDVLAALPVAVTSQYTPTPTQPANALERAMAAVAQDASARPALWRALYEGEVILPVVAYELIRPEGANFQFLTAPMGSTPAVFGFATDERFDALLPDGSQVSRVKPLGHQLPRFWPEGHWLMLNPGYDNQVVLSPMEVAGLPHGGRAELPHPRSVHLRAPQDDEQGDRLALLLDTVGTTPEVDHICWARVRAKKAARHVPWRDVLVVASAPPAVPDAAEHDAAEADGDETDGEAAALRAVTAKLRPGGFHRAIVVARQPGLHHPFIEAVVAAGRRVTAATPAASADPP